MDLKIENKQLLEIICELFYLVKQLNSDVEKYNAKIEKLTAEKTLVDVFNDSSTRRAFISFLDSSNA
ncbi:MAG: hypothetical protein LBC20_08585 [Planctomycetaceae bacterium]|nr:hypothetical protein [Planctomycetaceae bacterium]